MKTEQPIKVMNKEQIIDEAYENYQKEMLYHQEDNWLDDGNDSKCYRQLTKEEFINKCKTDPEFSEKWGLKIEERELSHDERFVIYKKVCNRDLQPHITGINFKQFHFDEYNIPTKKITITYKNETIESYE